MIGTFFEKWLIMGGWSGSNLSPELSAIVVSPGERIEDKKPSVEEKRARELENATNASNSDMSLSLSHAIAQTGHSINDGNHPDGKITQEELEKLIRAIAANSQLTAAQKNTTIQGLRDSVWKSNRKRNLEALEGGSSSTNFVHESQTILRKPASSRAMRLTPPSFFLQRVDSDIKMVWSSDALGKGLVSDESVPLFSASELAPTYHDGATAAVLGCPHYSRACKLRHPSSGRLYTCRLCCEQERTRHIPDAPLDRFAVTEVLCMRCGALQPADDRCNNPHCESQGKTYASYTCNICNFYENSTSKSIYHCPFCNVCRTGKGLGIDYRHCMRCNSCVSLADDNHVCIPQSLQGHCPICHEILFESTAPLRRLKCGHVMHLTCFNQYMRGQSYTCPLCKKSVEDMGTYWEKLDAAIRMQPMPEAYANTQSTVYCQDCGTSGKVKYHFVGLKCGSCGSYNTRETERIVER
uniref:Uncharacterized protein n=1 Tax=Leptocylindrus danicus TaxID=163516 RepID=A0A7S2LNN7_9STRA|mmetsp:Transcript_7788/g.11573  ORF Transcript_7788/g.11573 Transcript_7788/m.11573 type:complete len:468 (+) Transcript_7788:3-1406(+)